LFDFLKKQALKTITEKHQSYSSKKKNKKKKKKKKRKAPIIMPLKFYKFWSQVANHTYLREPLEIGMGSSVADEMFKVARYNDNLIWFI
jgi:hypothetical protein